MLDQGSTLQQPGHGIHRRDCIPAIPITLIWQSDARAGGETVEADIQMYFLGEYSGALLDTPEHSFSDITSSGIKGNRRHQWETQKQEGPASVFQVIHTYILF